MDELLEAINDMPEPTRDESSLAGELVELVRKHNHEPDDILAFRVAELMASDKRGYISHDTLTLNRYQYLTRNTAIYPNIGHNIVYPALGLVGEAGEVAEKVKKVLRDDGGVVTEVKRDELFKEIGDVLWYVSALAAEIDFTLGEIAILNLNKLNSRKKRGKIKGSGDNR